MTTTTAAVNATTTTTSTISDQTLMDKSIRSVFVGNIPYEATEENLKDIFSEVGPVLSFKLVFDRETGKPKGYGFCEYKDQETALSAMRNLNGYEISGRTLRVDNACTEKSRMEMQNLLQGQSTENPYGEAVQSDKAPEAISKAVASLPPEQMFELMRQMKLCVQNNPNEARQMLLQNPQLAYALLQAQVVMRIVDPLTAVNMLHKANPIPPVLVPSDNPPSLMNVPPPRIEEPWNPNRPPPPIPAPVVNPTLVAPPPTPIFSSQDVDLRTLDRKIDPRLSRMDQDLRGPPPTTSAPPPPLVTPPILPSAVSDPRSAVPPPPAFNMPESIGFGRDPRAERFARDTPRDPRDPRIPVDPRMAAKSNATTPVAPSTTLNTAAASGMAGSTARLMAGMPAGGIPSGASDQEKAALIMQVLQLSDEQIAMLPPEQRQSILVLKEQIAKSSQR